MAVTNGDAQQAMAHRIAELEAQLIRERGESQHQIRNILALIRSIARRTIQNVADTEPVFHQLDGRIAAFARVQSAALRDAGRAVELGGMIADELLAHGCRLDTIRLSPEKILIPVRVAALLALIVHELATASDPSRPIECVWAKRPGGGITIRWQSAAALGGQNPTTDFLNEMLHNALPYECSGSGTIAVEPDIVCAIDLPRACIIVPAPPTD